MRRYTAIVERCPETGLYVGHIPEFPGAHSQGRTPDELNRKLREIIKILFEDANPGLESEFVGTQAAMVA